MAADSEAYEVLDLFARGRSSIDVSETIVSLTLARAANWTGLEVR